MRRTFFILGSAMIALTACSNDGASNATVDMGNTATPAQGKIEDTTAAGTGMASAPMANTADAYVTNAAISDLYEIESSKLALDKSSSDAVKKFARQMIKDHTDTSAKLKSTIADAGIRSAPPSALDARRQGMLDNLRSLSGADFDKAYLDQQTAAHQEALTLHSDFARNGDNAPLKKLAAATAPRIQHHFDMVKQLDRGGADASH
jgi:putative membrane protein